MSEKEKRKRLIAVLSDSIESAPLTSHVEKYMVKNSDTREIMENVRKASIYHPDCKIMVFAISENIFQVEVKK